MDVKKFPKFIFIFKFSAISSPFKCLSLSLLLSPSSPRWYSTTNSPPGNGPPSTTHLHHPKSLNLKLPLPLPLPPRPPPPPPMKSTNPRDSKTMSQKPQPSTRWCHCWQTQVAPSSTPPAHHVSPPILTTSGATSTASSPPPPTPLYAPPSSPASPFMFNLLRISTGLSILCLISYRTEEMGWRFEFGILCYAQFGFWKSRFSLQFFPLFTKNYVNPLLVKLRNWRKI